QLRQVALVHPYLAGMWAQLRSNQAQQGGLAATGRPHDPGDLATRDTAIHLVENGARTAPKGQAFQFDGIGIIDPHPLSLATLVLSLAGPASRAPANWPRTIPPPPAHPNLATSGNIRQHLQRTACNTGTGRHTGLWRYTLHLLLPAVTPMTDTRTLLHSA